MAVAAALAAVALGLTWRLRQQSRPQPVIAHAPAIEQPAPAPAPPQTVAPQTVARVGRKAHRRAPAWREGEAELSPWYYNSALPPAARSVVVRSEVDASTAQRFGVLTPGEKVPVEIIFGDDGLPRAIRFVKRLAVQRN
jgi:hypothetical protein